MDTIKDPIDEVILEAALQNRVKASTLNHTERAWLVGQLTQRGETADQIGARIQVSRRTVKRLRRVYEQKFLA